jgi:enoyl-CoA hydratase/carnithine racemase
VSGLAAEARIVPLAVALDALRDPLALEAYSPLIGEPLLVVDFAAGDAPAEAIGNAAERLAQLPCPSVALRPEAATDDARILVPHFDLALDTESELEAVVRAVRHAPLASLALVQLLRHGERLDVHQGLVAESWVYSMLQSGPEFARWRASHARVSKPVTTPGPAVVSRREHERLQVTLNRPDRHNAFSAEMRDGLVEALQVAALDPSIREIVIDGAGPSFCSGGDLNEFGTFPDPATAHAVRSTRNASRAIAACAERVQVRVHGICMGAGVELPAFAARVVAHADTSFALPELEMGLVPGAGGTVSLPRRIGRQRTAWLSLTGQRLDATRARDWGLVDEIRNGPGDAK